MGNWVTNINTDYEYSVICNLFWYDSEVVSVFYYTCIQMDKYISNNWYIIYTIFITIIFAILIITCLKWIKPYICRNNYIHIFLNRVSLVNKYCIQNTVTSWLNFNNRLNINVKKHTYKPWRKNHSNTYIWPSKPSFIYGTYWPSSSV